MDHLRTHALQRSWALGSVLAGLGPARTAWLIDGQVAALAVDVGCSASLPDYALPGSGTGAVTISSWPMVSLPNSSGVQAPIVTTTAIVPKNIVADPVYGSNRKNSPGRFSEKVPASAQRGWKLLGEIDAHRRKGGQHGQSGNDRSGAHRDRCVVPGPMRHCHQRQAWNRAGETIGDRPSPPNDLHDEPDEELARNGHHEQQRAEPEAEGHRGALVDQRFRQQDSGAIIGGSRHGEAGGADEGPA